MAIDFGTSSTVVVLRERGRKKGLISPLRIGVADMSKPVKALHYENPTVLGFENIKNLEAAWRAQPWRPQVSWADAKCSHQAREELKNRVKSGMTGLKSWARKKATDPPLLLQDEQGEGIEFSVPAEAPAQDIVADFATAPLNPIELYAFYLGLHLNNQLVNNGRIFTNYYMTFPVGFEAQTKERILASFRRGLLRSLPASLIYATNFNPDRLRVREHANEAAAYAAAVLDLMENPSQGALSPEPDLPRLRARFEELLQDLPEPNPIQPSLEDNDNFWAVCGAFMDSFRQLEKIRPELEEVINFFTADPLLTDFYLRLNLERIAENFEDDRALALECARLMDNAELRQNFLQKPEHGRFAIMIMEAGWRITRLLAAFAILKEIRALARPAQLTDGEAVTATAQGSAFGVFDFGGGTTDFALGLYRLPDDSEKMAQPNKDKIIDILDSSGDPDLGGEHLVRLLAYETVRRNKETLLALGLAFTPVESAEPVLGGELLFNNSVIARANNHKLMEKLRPIWEGGGLQIDGDQISETFTSLDGQEKTNVSLEVDVEELNELLRKRIGKGVRDFFSLAGQSLARDDIKRDSLHVILAGNSCKSPLVMACFEDFIREHEKMGSGSALPPKIVIHPPLLPDDARPEKVTLKTGVAIGILKSLPSEPIAIVMRGKQGGEAPFAFTVGRNAGGLLLPKLKRNAPYDGDWQEFGPASEAVLVLYTKSPRGDSGEARRGMDCAEDELEFVDPQGKTIVLKPKTPSCVIFALRDASGAISEEQELDLEED